MGLRIWQPSDNEENTSKAKPAQNQHGLDEESDIEKGLVNDEIQRQTQQQRNSRQESQNWMPINGGRVPGEVQDWWAEEFVRRGRPLLGGYWRAVEQYVSKDRPGEALPIIPKMHRSYQVDRGHLLRAVYAELLERSQRWEVERARVVLANIEQEILEESVEGDGQFEMHEDMME